MKFPLLILLILFFGFNCFSQSNFNLFSDSSEKIRFNLIDNLIVIPVEINGVKLSFLLDTGVSKPILFNLVNLADSLKINQVESIYLRGLGGGESIEALRSTKNLVRIGNAINVNQDLFVILDESINFTPRLGVPIHGIIGFDLFKDLIVEVNYSNRYIRFFDPKYYRMKKCKKCDIINLSFYNNKPYIDLEVEVKDQFVPVKLLIDSGGSDALWLFEDESQDLSLEGKPYFHDFLGLSLSGSVYGKRSKMKRLKIASFELQDVNVAFPDSTAIVAARLFAERNGSISGELLKRFNWVFDYRGARVMLKKNGMFKNKFNYNKSGITLEQNGVRLVREKNIQNLFPSNYGRSDENNVGNKIEIVSSYSLAVKPAIVIVEIRKDSPAERAGLLIGDIVINVNGKDTAREKLQEVLASFYGNDGKKISMLIDRNGLLMNFRFKLEPVLKEKSPQN